MNHSYRKQGRLPAVLAASLLFLCLLPGTSARAEELTPSIPEETYTSTLPLETEEIIESTIQDTIEDSVKDDADDTTKEAAGFDTETKTGTELSSQTENSGFDPAAESLDAALTFWYPVSLEDILPTDILAITITNGSQTWALSWESTEFSAPKAIPVRLEGGGMRSCDAGLNWQLERTKDGLILRPENTQVQLYTDNGDDALRVSGLGSPYWISAGDTLSHPYTGRFLCVDPIQEIWCALLEPEPGQTLAFWRQERCGYVTATPAGGALSLGETVSLSCGSTEGEIYWASSYDGVSYSGFQRYEQPIVMEMDSLYIKAYATAPDMPASPEAVFHYVRTPEAEEKPDWDLPFHCYFGLLHAHTNISDGQSSVEDTFAYAAGMEGLNFFAVTDHSNSFQNASAGQIHQDGSAVSEDWARGKAAAKSMSGSGFLGLFGYEMSWPPGKNLGHIGTFATPGWQSWKQAEFASLKQYYQTLGTVPGSIGQFNHPDEFFGNCEEFAHYCAAYDHHMNLLEIGSEDGLQAFPAYTQALDLGWHVAPTASLASRDSHWTGTTRTVLLAPELTEEALYTAMRQRRAYATDDSDLEIYFTLNGAPMGSVLPILEDLEVSAFLSDSTDGAIGLVEVIAEGSKAVASQLVDTPWAELQFSVPAGHPYYYLRITQADGDIAVTAPVWLDDFQDLGVSDFRAGTPLAVQGENVKLTASLFNEETVPFSVTDISLYAGDQLVSTFSDAIVLAPGESRDWMVSYTPPQPGTIQLRLLVTGTVLEETRSYEKTLTLRCHAIQQVGDILIDGSHKNVGLDELSRFLSIAGEADMRVNLFTEGVPSEGKLLLIPPPREALDEAFVEGVNEFLKNGGSLLVFGTGSDNRLQNHLLQDIGSSLRFGGRIADSSTAARYQKDSPWSAGISPKSPYYHHDGCLADSGNGSWLVKNASGRALLSYEKTSSGGFIFACGSLFLADDAMPEPWNKWDPASANQQILEAILNIHRETLPLSTIRDARGGKAGDIFRIQGYATTGTVNPGNTFPGTLCLQDDTGGIPIVDFTDKGIPVGAPLEAVGRWEERDGNPVLALIDYQLLPGNYYRYVPKTLPCRSVMDFGERGGQLLQAEGTVTALTLTEDGKGIARLTLKDMWGGYAEVVIGEGIFSGSRGTNTLASQIQVGRTVRAMGILYLEDGQPVLRVRNCEEVVYVPPLPNRENPKTGDSHSDIFPLLVIACESVAFLVLMGRRRRKQR